MKVPDRTFRSFPIPKLVSPKSAYVAERKDSPRGSSTLSLFLLLSLVNSLPPLPRELLRLDCY